MGSHYCKYVRLFCGGDACSQAGLVGSDPKHGKWDSGYERTTQIRVVDMNSHEHVARYDLWASSCGHYYGLESYKDKWYASSRLCPSMSMKGRYCNGFVNRRLRLHNEGGRMQNHTCTVDRGQFNDGQSQSRSRCPIHCPSRDFWMLCVREEGTQLNDRRKMPTVVRNAFAAQS